MPKVRVEGTTLVVGRTRVDLRFLRTEVAHSNGTSEPRVRVRCAGCGRRKSVRRVGLRVNGEGVVDLQPNCVDCRSILNARARKVG